jgi:hypothetical protein
MSTINDLDDFKALEPFFRIEYASHGPVLRDLGAEPAAGAGGGGETAAVSWTGTPRLDGDAHSIRAMTASRRLTGQ